MYTLFYKKNQYTKKELSDCNEILCAKMWPEYTNG